MRPESVVKLPDLDMEHLVQIDDPVLTEVKFVGKGHVCSKPPSSGKELPLLLA